MQHSGHLTDFANLEDPDSDIDIHFPLKMSKITFTSAALAALAGVTNAATAEQWALRSVYQVMTDRYALPDGSTDKECPELDKYCGGTWSGIINKLDYIQDMGFNAVQISPVVENIKDDTPYGEAYHGYWPVNNYALNTNFGTEDDLKKLAKTLHDRDMYLMVDVVINDMAQAIDGVMPQPIDYSLFNPFNNEKFFTPYCNITDFENRTIAQNCWLGNENIALPDLDTHSDEVIKMTGDWIKELVSNYSIDGLRIDAAKHVSDNFLPLFIEAAGVFTFGEVYTGDTDAQCRYQQLGLVAGLPNYIEYFPMIQAFTVGNMKDLAEQKDDTRAQCNDTTVLGTFSENHDLPRWPSFVQDMTLIKNAMSYVILNDGIPISKFSDDSLCGYVGADQISLSLPRSGALLERQLLPRQPSEPLGNWLHHRYATVQPDCNSEQTPQSRHFHRL